jgi:hypothetical protein
LFATAKGDAASGAAVAPGADYAISEQRFRRGAKSASLPATVRRHWLPVTAHASAIVVPYIADAPIDIREGCPFPPIGKTADSAIFHTCVGAARAVRFLWLRLGMGGLHEHRAGDQERCKRSVKDFHGRSFRRV